MPVSEGEQIRASLRIGIDVGGTFTDLVACDGERLRIIKVPSTPPNFEEGVVSALSVLNPECSFLDIIHGSTVATNALLQRHGEKIAFITTQGFRDMLLIGRQNRPHLYALEVTRPAPITPEENFFTVKERIDAKGNILTPLDSSDIENLVNTLRQRNIEHAAVCLLFSFVNPAHERRIGEALEQSGITVSLSSEILPEFREYERASTTAINAALRPTVEEYLSALKDRISMRGSRTDLRIIQSTGGTASPSDAARRAATLVLSGPAGGVIGAAYMARLAGHPNVITYDMGGTSTDVAAVRDASPQWTTSTIIDGLPIALPMFDIHTVGAGGGSIAYRDLGGSLRVGPQSAGAVPGPACYNRGGTEPTVTDANVLLGRILPDQFLGGAMKIEPDLARSAIDKLARELNLDITATALGILKIAEANMASAVRAVTSRRGHDPRQFALLSFGGAGGLHACAIADLLEITRIVVSPYCGALSALGMVVAPESIDLSRSVVQIKELDDARLQQEFRELKSRLPPLPLQQRAGMRGDFGTTIAYFADVRFKGQSHELSISVETISLNDIRRAFETSYEEIYGRIPTSREIQIVTLRLRRSVAAPELRLPAMKSSTGQSRQIELVDDVGEEQTALACTRSDIISKELRGPLLLIDPEATTFVAKNWSAVGREDGVVILKKE